MERTHLLTSFQDFGLADPISRALKEENYHTPTPIQAQTIPLALTGRDVVGIAQTGTGKTAAFALPILHRILENRIKPQPKACRSEEHTSELQSRQYLVCRLLLEKKKK